MDIQKNNELSYIDANNCSHMGLNYCNKCSHRKIFENNNIPYKTCQHITNNIKTTYTFILY